MFRRKIFAALLPLLAVAIIGCEKETEPGGPGVKSPDPSKANSPNQREVANEDRVYKLTVPSGTIDVEQGTSEKIVIGIERGDKLTEDVTVSLKATQTGLSVTPDNYTFSGEKTEFEATVSATGTTNVGETAISVIGKFAAKDAKTGEDATDEVNERINIEVTKGDGDSDN